MTARLHYDIQGDGEVIMILHGLFGSMKNWRSVARQLAETYQVVLLDMRNHGQSEHSDSMTYIDMADDINTLIQELGFNEVTLLGHSMGGKAAMVAALRYENFVKKLIVVDIAPVTYSHTYEKIFIAMGNLLTNNFKSRTEAEKLMDETINDQWLTQFLLQNLQRDIDGFRWQLNFASIKNNMEHIKSFPDFDNEVNYTKPALFLGGADSDFIADEYHAKIKSYFPAAEIAKIENAGHMLHIEQPEKVLEAVKTFLL